MTLADELEEKAAELLTIARKLRGYPTEGGNNKPHMEVVK